MRLFRIGIFMLLFTATFKSSAQQDDITTLIKSISDNYAGYFDKVKGDNFTKYIEKVLREEKQDTFRMLIKIAAFFDNPHLQVHAPFNQGDFKIDSGKCSQDLGWVTRKLAEQQTLKDAHEGYWITDRHTAIIAIVKKKSKPSCYVAYQVEARTSIFPPGYPLAQFDPIGGQEYLADFTLPGNGFRFSLKSVFRNDSILTTGDLVKWKKLPKGSAVPSLKNFELINRPVTRGTSLDDDNYLLTLPDFGAGNISLIDSIIKTDYKKIASAKNLIIDVRGNTGGTVRNYQPLIPFVYSRPIVGIPGSIRCTPYLLQHKIESLDRHKKSGDLDTNIIADMAREITKIKANIGHFLFIAGDTIKRDTVMPKPKNIGIIVDFACESATEMMLLDFKQSSKVTVFGEHTMGAVDYLDTYTTELPSGKYILTFATVKRHIPKGEKKIDGHGIYPEVKISGDVSDWVQFVKEYYEKHSAKN